MANTQKISWKRLTVEAAAIVGSILLAFAIDAWWEQQKEVRDEQELLVSLVREFELTRDELKFSSENHEDRRTAARKLSTMSATTIDAVSLAELADLLYRASSWLRSDPPRGALNGAITSGRLALIRDKRLEALLAGWGNRLADTGHTENDLADYLLRVFLPDIGQRVLVPYEVSDASPELKDVLLLIPMKNHLNFVEYQSKICVSENEALQERVDEILDLLRSQLEH